MKTKNNITGIQLILTAALAGGLFSTAGNAQSAEPTPIPVTALRNSNPYNFVGKITTDRGAGSGTVIKPYSVLTAGHVLYTPGKGFKDTIRFWRAYSKSNTSAVNNANCHICRERWVLRGYTENVEREGKSASWSAYSRDTGAIVFWTRPLNGGYAGRWQNPSTLTGTGYKMSLGYGAVWHDGLEVLRASTTSAFFTTPAASCYENSSFGIEAGMSGGPVFVPYGTGWYVSAVNVSGRTAFSGGGVRAIDADTTSLIVGILR